MLQISSGMFLPKISKIGDIWQSYHKNKKGDVFSETQCILNGPGFGLVYDVLGLGFEAQVLGLDLGLEGQVLGLGLCACPWLQQCWKVRAWVLKRTQRQTIKACRHMSCCLNKGQRQNRRKHKPISSMSESFDQIIDQHGIRQWALVRQSLKQIWRTAFWNGCATLTWLSESLH